MKTIQASIPSLLALLVVLPLAGCATIGDIFGGRDDRPADPRIDEVRGTVSFVDTRDSCIELERTDYDRRLRNEDACIRYDNRTVVEYQGRTYRPEDLEPGDEIVAQVDSTAGGRLIAERIDVVHDVSGGGARDDDRVADATLLRGTVRRVDTRERFIELDRVDYRRGFTSGDRGGDRVTVYYDADTDVIFEGRQYRPDNLEAGDRIEVEAVRREGVLLAEEVHVLEDVRAGGRGSS